MPSIDLGSVNIDTLSSGRGQAEYYDTGFSEVGSFGVRVNSGGRRSFFLVLRVAGVRKRVTLGQHPAVTLERARLIAAEYLSQAAGGKDPVAVFGKLRRPMFFSDLVLEYQKVELPSLGAESTRREYSRIISRELLPALGGFRLSAIGPSDLRRLVDSVKADRGRPVMAERTAATLRRIFNFGLQKGFIEQSPFLHLKEKELEPEEPAVRRVIPRFLPPTEIKLLWEATRSEKPVITSIFRLLLLTGQRPGDLLALRWEEIQGDTWRIGSRKGETGDALPVFLPPPVQVLLRETPGYGNSVGPVFTGRRGVPIRHIRKAAERIRIRAGLKEGLSPVDLRRTVEYGMRSIGIRPDIVDRALGRKVPARRSGVYLGYDYTSDVRNAFRSWAQYVWKLVNERPSPGTTPPRDEKSDQPKQEPAKVIPLFR